MTRSIRFKFSFTPVFIPILFILFLGSRSFSAGLAAPIESNPFLAAFLSCVLPVMDANDEAKVESINEFLELMRFSVSPSANVSSLRKPIRVLDLKAYLKIRNQTFSSPQEALIAFKQKGIINPFLIQVPNDLVMQEIVDYEVKALTRFKEFAETKLNSGDNVLELPGGIWNQLPNLYATARSVYDVTDKGSQAVMNQAFTSANQNLESGRMASGVFSFFVGATTAVARSAGQAFVNPLVRSQMFGPRAFAAGRELILQEVTKLGQLSNAEKLNLYSLLIAQMNSEIQQAASTVANIQAFEKLRTEVPVARVLLAEFLPKYIAGMSSSQKSQLVWQVLSEPDFAKLKMEKQFQTATKAMGPILPYLLQSLARHPNLAGGPLKQFLQRPGPETHVVSRSTDDLMSAAFVKAYPSLKLKEIQPRPVAVSALKESYVATVDDGTGDKQVLIQVVRSGVRRGLQEEIQLLRSMMSDSKLVNDFAEAGFKDLPIIVESLIEMITAELDLSQSEVRIQHAEQQFAKRIESKVLGQKLTTEIRVPRVIRSELNSNGQVDNEFLVQEFVSGELSLEDGLNEAPEQVREALRIFTQVYLELSFSGSGGRLVWVHPLPQNIKVKVSADKSQVQLTLLNLDHSGIVTSQEIGDLLRSLGKLPMSEILNANGMTELDLESLQKSVELGQTVGLKLDPYLMRVGEGLFSLQELVGREVVFDELRRFAIKNPRIAWRFFQPFLASSFHNKFIEPVKGIFKSNAGVTCEALSSSKTISAE